MGYDTDFEGEFKLDRHLEGHHRAYLQAFSETRRIRRNEHLTVRLEDKLRALVSLEVGEEGCYYVGGAGEYSHGDPAVLDCNNPPRGQPGLWCKWEPNEDGSTIRWSGVEKFYDYVEWIEYIVSNFLVRWNYVLSGEVTYQGEDPADFGIIRVKDNVVENVAGVRVIPDEQKSRYLRTRLDEYVEELGQIEDKTVAVVKIMDDLQHMLYECDR